MTFLKFLLVSHLFLVHFVLNSTWIICMCWHLWKPHSFDAIHTKKRTPLAMLYKCFIASNAHILVFLWYAVDIANTMKMREIGKACHTTTKRWSNYMACTWRCLGNKKGENLGRFENKNVKLKLSPILLMRSLLSIVHSFSLN